MTEFKIDAKTRQVTTDDGKVFNMIFLAPLDSWSHEFALRGRNPDAEAAEAAWNAALAEGKRQLETRCLAAYGPQWQNGLSEDLGIPAKTIQQWHRGKLPFTMDHSAWAEINAALERDKDFFEEIVRLAVMDAPDEIGYRALAKSIQKMILAKGYKIVKT